ncbi:MAG: thioredoxin family protein [Micropruina sp.]|nr:thioredoxin family protein [Micropruina sp.]
MTGVIVVCLCVLVALCFGVYRKVTDGRAREAGPSLPRLSEGQLGSELGSAATLVQFSSAVCAPCRTTRTLLTGLVAQDPGLAHIEVDAEARLDLVAEFGITRTPTVLLLDRSGTVRHRMDGAPRKPQVLDALGSLRIAPAA